MDKTIEKLIKDELERANKKFPLFASEHEGCTVMLEEFVEAVFDIQQTEIQLNDLWSYTKNKKVKAASKINQTQRIKNQCIKAIQELIQLSAMCDKYEVSLKDKE